ITFPFLLKRTGVLGAFGVYAGFNVFALIMIFFFVPETKQRTLEELDYVFAVPSRKFAEYQVTKFVPWFIKRWIFWQRNAKLEPLYKFDSVKREESPNAQEGTQTNSLDADDKKTGFG